MKKIYVNYFKGIVVSIFLSATNGALALGNSTGQVTVPVIGATYGVFMFKAGTPAGQPACVQVPSQPWVLNVKTDGGKATYALLLSAQAQGKTVSVSGTGVCDVWGDRETVDAVMIN